MPEQQASPGEGNPSGAAYLARASGGPPQLSDYQGAQQVALAAKGPGLEGEQRRAGGMSRGPHGAPRQPPGQQPPPQQDALRDLSSPTAFASQLKGHLACSPRPCPAPSHVMTRGPGSPRALGQHGSTCTCIFFR